MPGRLIGGRYRLESVLGRGGMAEVWRAVDERLGRPVAVKVLDREAADSVAMRRFEREAQAIARLTHPNVVAVYDVGVELDTAYLVMELVDGGPLSGLLATGPMAVDDAVRMAAQVCDALQAAHDAGVVHRDIKPDNILVTPAGVVKVLDFGIARVVQAAGPRLTGAAVAMGTGAFMAPEQAAGGPVDARTDLYALGCVLYAMLTGGPPFHSDDPLGLLWLQINQPAVPVATVRPDVPAALDALVGQLLAKSPADRPGTAAEVRQRLDEISGTGAAGAAPTAHPMRGQAAVLSPTRSLPVLEADEPTATPAPGRFRLGPAGIAAVAVAAAVVTALAVAVLTAGRQGRQGTLDTPGTLAPTSASVTAGTGDTPAATLAAARSAIDAQMRAGTLDARTARDLTKRLDEIARDVAKGDLDKAAEKTADLRRRLDDLRDDERLTAAGYDAIAPTLDRLAAGLPPAGNGED